MPALQHINPVCGANLGGLQFLRVYQASNVLSVADPVGSIIQEPLQLLNEEDYANIFFPEGSFEEIAAEDEHGEFYKAKIKISVPRDSPDVLEAISRLRGIKAVCVYIDANGYAKVIGTPDYPLRFSADLQTGARVKDKNLRELTFYGDMPERAWFYLHQELVPAGTRKVFSAGFSSGFRKI